ncbi:MAG TPA: ankyrin repeat domain-containing protein [Phycisphaerae bacterium]|nr:ankyrin repeat domain-containing protein [Phycisphaerae bacterium]HNU44966.1 ankyrin repeat domain-containing protein [Phycisphaerae bacterium]
MDIRTSTDRVTHAARTATLRRAIAVYLLATLAPMSAAHEADQYTVPSGREFADLRLYFSEQFHGTLTRAMEKTNNRIRRSLKDGEPTSATARLQSPEVIAQAVLHEFPSVAYYIEGLEGRLRRTDVQERYPGLVVAYQPTFWIYHHPALLLDPTKLVRLWRTSTIMIDGTYLGTDKLAHFLFMGHIYYTGYCRARARGQVDAEAARQAVQLGAGSNLFFSENALLGRFTTGVRSNADLAANYAGMKFFLNLTETVRVRGRMQPPMLVREGPCWRLNDHVHPASDFFTVFVTDHWDEALNPSALSPEVRPWVRQGVQQRCPDLVLWYHDEQGRPRTRADFVRTNEELRTYFGEDYGYIGVPEELVSIATCCFAAPAATGPDEVVTQPGDAAPDAAAAGSLGPGSVDTSDRLGRTPLWWAACRGDVDAVRELLAHGAAVDVADLDRQTPLHAAARGGHVAVVELLLAHGADAETRAQYGLTPLHLAVRGVQPDAARVLLRHHARADAADDFGCTPLHDAAGRGHELLVTELLAAGANPNAGDTRGTTPLHRAARVGSSGVVARLLAAGADPGSRDAFGQTPPIQTATVGAPLDAAGATALIRGG